MAERAGFEPAVPEGTHAFEARSFNHSDTSPHEVNLTGCFFIWNKNNFFYSAGIYGVNKRNTLWLKLDSWHLGDIWGQRHLETFGVIHDKFPSRRKVVLLTDFGFFYSPSPKAVESCGLFSRLFFYLLGHMGQAYGVRRPKLFKFLCSFFQFS